MNITNDILITFINHWIPNFEVKFKNESLLHKIIGVLVWIFNRQYMTNFTTVIGNTIYFPSKKFLENRNGTLAGIFLHEFVHMWDYNQLGGFLFYWKYFFPQVVGLFILLISPLTFLIPIPDVWILFLCIVGFGCMWLFPWNARGRTDIELRGYLMNIYLIWRQKKFVGDLTKENVVKQFTSWNYYKMWKDGKKIKEKIENFVEVLNRIEGHLTKYTTCPEMKPFILVKNFLDDLN